MLITFMSNAVFENIISISCYICACSSPKHFSAMLNNGLIRELFPALSRAHKGHSFIYLDGPGGTQVPQAVIDKISGYYKHSNANTHGAFASSRETDTVVHNARKDMAVFLGAEGPDTISFGQNMTSLNYSLARAIVRILQPGDEVLITQLDHEGNRGPWLMMREFGIIVREVAMLQDGSLDYRDLQEKIGEKTRLVAVGMASNALGTVNDIKRIRQLAYENNAWLLVDAVHYAPHFSIDVQALGCDFLLCSAYKFYGPHVGVLYSRPGLLDRLMPDRLITTDQHAPYSIETGTLNHAALAGVSAAVAFIASLGEGATLREKLLDAFRSIGKHERNLAGKLYQGLKALPGVKVYGLPFKSDIQRAPTLSFTIAGISAADVCRILAEKNICAWDGHFYALRAIQLLGLLERGGVIRMGVSIYNNEEEIEQVIEAVNACI